MATIEYFYSAYSAFAYLGSDTFAKMSMGHTIIHKPVDLGRIIPGAGAAKFSARSAAHKNYYFRREIERWAQYRSAPVMKGRPTHHSNDITLANCMLIAMIEARQDPQQLAHAMLQSHWRDDSDLSDRAALKALGDALGLDSSAFLNAADTADIQGIYAANTEEAVQRSVFGSPTYFVDGDMFYGQDRLELVEQALKKPFVGQWP